MIGNVKMTSISMAIRVMGILEGGRNNGRSRRLSRAE